MLGDFLIVHKSILPDFYTKVVDARNILDAHPDLSVSEVVKQVGISRSTYYKYKDYIFIPENSMASRKAVINMTLAHEEGTLSNVLNTLSRFGTSILTISQSIPIADKASVSLSLDLTNMRGTLDNMLDELRLISGVLNVHLASVE